MRKIRAKQEKAVKPEAFFESKNNIMITGAIVVVILLIIGVLLYIENTDSKIVINNKTDLKVEYLKAYYVGPEEAYTEEINITDLTAGKKESLPQETINLYGAEANLEIRFKIEGYDEMLVDAGYFNDVFSGKISINFVPVEDGKIKLTVKAKPGIFGSKRIVCDDYYTINLAEGYIED